MTKQVLERLDPGEQAVAGTLKGRRQIEFAGGRLAWRAARPGAGPLRIGERGEPLAPADCSVSLTHKQDLALALVGDAAAGTVGLDLEGDSRERMAISRRVLRPEEHERMLRLPERAQWREVLLAFAIKEAAYKAVHPHLLRFVGFQEASVSLGEAGAATVSIVTEPGLILEAHWEPLAGPRVLAMVRARRR